MPAAARRALLTVLLTALAVGASATTAVAHTELTGTTPVAGSAVDDAPTSVSMTFSGDLLPVGATVLVTDAAGASLAADAPIVTARRLVQLVSPSTAPGQVRVVWRVVAQDGHQMQGSFGYAVAGSPAAAATPTASVTVPGEQQASSVKPAEAVRTERSDGVALLAAGLGAAAVAVLVAALGVALRRRRT